MRVVAQWHGWDSQIRDAPAWTFGLLGGLHLVLTEIQRQRLIAWGVDEARIFSTKSPYDPDALPKQRVDGPPTVVFLGRLTEEKGVNLLIGAIARTPELRCLIAGEGPARTAINMAILRYRCSDRVELTGWLDAQGRRSMWERASVLVLPSADESYPLAIVEALAAGVPVVATAVGAVPALLSGAGLLTERSVEALADNIRAALASPPPTLASVRDEILRTHHPRAVAEDWSAVYRIAAL